MRRTSEREMASRHISVPKPFAAGDADEWFQRFEICCRANGWNEETKALKLPTLLEGEAIAVWLELTAKQQGVYDTGEAIAVWLELTAKQQGVYDTAKKEIVKKLSPAGFAFLDEFHQRKLRPSESLSVFVHDLKRLLEQAMPELSDKKVTIAPILVRATSKHRQTTACYGGYD